MTPSSIFNPDVCPELQSHLPGICTGFLWASQATPRQNGIPDSLNLSLVIFWGLGTMITLVIRHAYLSFYQMLLIQSPADPSPRLWAALSASLPLGCSLDVLIPISGLCLYDASAGKSVP